MFELLWGFVIFVLGISAGMQLMARTIQKAASKQESETIQDLAQQLANQLIFLRVEKDADLFFAYNAVSGDFVCQGITMKNLSENFGVRYPSKKGILITADEDSAHELV
jgi:Tfp pilus assembly protein PilV